MITEHLRQLPNEVPIYVGRQEFVVDYAKGKNVLHLGCVDQGVTQQKFEQGNLLHEKVYRVAKTLWGVDIDEAGLNWMRDKGYPNLYLANLEYISSIPEIFTQKFNLIIFTEVLEHLDNPGLVLDRLHDLVGIQTEMIITVPNSTSLTNLFHMFSGKELVNPDHNYWFSFNTIKTLLHKHGYEIIQVALYSQFDYQKSLLKYLKNKILGLFKPINVSGEYTNIKPTPSSAHKISRFPRIGAWIRLVIQTNIYRYFLQRNPYFADGLIFVVRSSK